MRKQRRKRVRQTLMKLRTLVRVARARFSPAATGGRRREKMDKLGEQGKDEAAGGGPSSETRETGLPAAPDDGSHRIAVEREKRKFSDSSSTHP